MKKLINPKYIPILLAIAAAFLVGSLAASGDATANVNGAGNNTQAALVLQAEQPPSPPAGSEPLVPVGTSFTYQGRLKDGPNPANGQYDFRFTLYDAPTGGTGQGNLFRFNQTVNDGLVTIQLDFGPFPFEGDARYLEVEVRPAGTGGSFTPLTPRQPVSPAPYAISLRPGATIGNDGTSPYALLGESVSGDGLRGRSLNNCCSGVRGFNTSTGTLGSGVRGESTNGIGVYGIGGTLAGHFEGNVRVNGQLSKASGTFKIDHPLDPANKYLYHSFVESPDMMNIYNGNTTTDANGTSIGYKSARTKGQPAYSLPQSSATL